MFKFTQRLVNCEHAHNASGLICTGVAFVYFVSCTLNYLYLNCVIIRYYKRKAEETCTALLDAIAPHQGQRLKKIVN